MIFMDELQSPPETILLEGCKSLGIFHKDKVVKLLPNGDVMSEDFVTLLYYANKLSNLELENDINWEKVNFKKA